MNERVTSLDHGPIAELDARTIGSQIFPPAPEHPLDSDCCGGGCTPCVMDIYQQELELWQEECAHIMSGEAENKTQDVANKVICL